MSSINAGEETNNRSAEVSRSGNAAGHTTLLQAV